MIIKINILGEYWSQIIVKREKIAQKIIELLSQKLGLGSTKFVQICDLHIEIHNCTNNEIGPLSR